MLQFLCQVIVSQSGRLFLKAGKRLNFSGKSPSSRGQLLHRFRWAISSVGSHQSFGDQGFSVNKLGAWFGAFQPRPRRWAERPSTRKIEERSDGIVGSGHWFARSGNALFTSRVELRFRSPRVSVGETESHPVCRFEKTAASLRSSAEVMSSAST